MKISFLLAFHLFLTIALIPDTVVVKGGETLTNVKVNQGAKKGDIIVTEKSGATRIFKSNQVTVTEAPVVWEEPVAVEKKPTTSSFFNFLKLKEDKPSVLESADKASVAEAAGQVPPEPPKSFREKYFAEMFMAGFALLWLVL